MNGTLFKCLIVDYCVNLNFCFWLHHLFQTINNEYCGDGMSLRLINPIMRNLGTYDYANFKWESSMIIFRIVLNAQRFMGWDLNQEFENRHSSYIIFYWNRIPLVKLILDSCWTGYVAMWINFSGERR